MLQWTSERLKVEKCCSQAPCGSLKRNEKSYVCLKGNCRYVLNFCQNQILGTETKFETIFSQNLETTVDQRSVTILNLQTDKRMDGQRAPYHYMSGI